MMERQNRAKDITLWQVKQALEKANHILLTVHVHPDGDALGSLLAMYEYLVREGKQVTMVVDDVVPVKFRTLPYVDKILSPSEVDNSVVADLLVVLDASTFERIGRVGHIAAKEILNIDHHISNSRYADQLYLEASCAATGEILAHFFETWEADITPSMANALYLAIGTDCGFYKYGNTKGPTLRAGAYCVEHGASPQYISEMVELTTVERLKAMEMALQTVSFHCSGKVAKIVVNHSLMQMVQDDTDGFVDLIRNVAGVDIAILFKEYEAKQTRVSFRSKTEDVNVIAAKFGGGGHIRAAGCTVKAPLAEAIETVLNTVAASI